MKRRLICSHCNQELSESSWKRHRQQYSMKENDSMSESWLEEKDPREKTTQEVMKNSEEIMQQSDFYDSFELRFFVSFFLSFFFFSLFCNNLLQVLVAPNGERQY